MSKNSYRDGKKQVSVVVSPLLHRQLVTTAANRGVSMTDIVLQALREFIENTPLVDKGASAPALAFRDEPLSFEDGIQRALDPKPIFQPWEDPA
jgi:hypothetical protein